MEHTPMTPFDLLTTSQSLRMAKLLLPYLPQQSQKSLAMLIRYQELTSTYDYFQDFDSSKPLSTQALGSLGAPGISPVQILEDIAPYLDAKTAQTLQSIRQATELIHMMEESDSNQNNEETQTNKEDSHYE